MDDFDKRISELATSKTFDDFNERTKQLKLDKMRKMAPHICWGDVGCDEHYCFLDKGHIGDCVSMHVSPCKKRVEGENDGLVISTSITEAAFQILKDYLKHGGIEIEWKVEKVSE